MTETPAPSEEVVTYEVVDQVARITLNRPEYRNAQNSKMTYALDAAFQRATDDDDVKVIVLAGNGKHFCAGHDIGTPGRDVDQTFERKAVIWWDHTDKEGGDQRFARERLANFKVPREVVFVDALPRNLGGKVLKTELRSAS